MALTPLKLEFLQALGSFWTDIFEGSDQIDLIAEANSTYLQPFQDFSENSAKYVSVDEIPTHLKEDLVLYVFTDRVFVDSLGVERRESTSAAIAYGGGRAYDDGSYYGEYEGTGRNVYDIDGDREPFYLSPFRDGSSVLINGVDYTVEDGTIRFNEPLSTTTNAVEVQASDDGDTIYVYHMWGFATKYDIKAVRVMFGALTRVYGESGETYKEAVRIAWDLQVLGANAINTDRVCSFLAGVGHYDGPGNELVQDVFDEAGFVWVETASGVYGAPEATPLTLGVGDLVEKGDKLFDVYSIYSGETLPAPTLVTGLMLSKGFLGPDYEDTLFLENALVPTARVYTEDWYYVQTDGAAAYNVKDADGAIIKTVSTDLEAQTYVQNMPEKIWVYGDTQHYESPQVYQFMLWLNATGFFDDLADKYGRVPNKINPMSELRDYLFGPNLTIIAVEVAADRAAFVAQLVKVLSRTWPAGSAFVFYAMPDDYEDVISAEYISEGYDLFYAMDASESTDDVSDVTLASKVLARGGS